MKPDPRVLLLTLALALLAGCGERYGEISEYEQILPRGRIAPIVDPVYVDAAAARIPGDAFVLGVVVEGQPRAYSLNLLNSHEVVNDRIGETSFAAVW